MRRLVEIKKILFQHKALLAEKFKIKAMYVFGSYVRGENKKKSDIDILVDFSEPIGLFAFMDLEEYLQQILNIKVDVVSRKALKPRIGKYILEEAVAI